MRAPAVSFTHKLAAVTLAALLTFTLVPLAYADGEGSGSVEDEAAASGLPDQSNDSADSSSGEPQGVSTEQDAEGSPVAPMLASGLVGKPSNFINSDVALDGEPVIGSFTLDGLTFAVIDESTIELVGVSEAAGASPRRVVASSQGLEAPDVLPDLGSTPAASEADADAGMLMLPESVAYEGTTYALASIAPYAFYLSGVTSVTLPASVNDVDDRAFRSSDVASVSVADGNASYSSYDGAIYDTEQLSLLLIPEGKQGTVRIPKTAEIAEASVFSHCPLVDAISVDAGSAAFASENGLLYTSDLTTLLRVPAGATESTIREGCTTIAAGALEACANLTTINAPATVTSISPDIFHAIPTVSLPAASLAEETSQFSAMVALSSNDDDLPEVSPSSITVSLPKGSIVLPWERIGCMIYDGSESGSKPIAETQKAASARGNSSQSGAPETPIAGQPNLMICAPVTTIHARGIYDQQYYGLTNCPKNKWFRATISYANYVCVWLTKDGTLGYGPTAHGSSGYYLGVNTSYTGVKSVAAGTSRGNLKPISSGGSMSFARGEAIYVSINGATADVTLSYDARGGTFADGSTSVKTKKGSGSKLSDVLYPADPTKLGYTFAGWWTSATGGAQVTASTALPTSNKTYYAHWSLNPYAITYDLAGGSVSGNPTTYNTETATFTLKSPVKQGYTFTGWSGTGLSGSANKTVTIEKGSVGDRTYTAHWEPALSADVPLEVEARVDVLGIEEPEEASGYIESRCGEPLKVAEVKLTPLDGAKELFGAGNVSDVFLEVLANNGASPNARFSLGSSATESDASRLQALTMASYGARVPISYRFAMPSEVQTSLLEHADPKPVCTVAYTVALA